MKKLKLLLILLALAGADNAMSAAGDAEESPASSTRLARSLDGLITLMNGKLEEYESATGLTKPKMEERKDDDTVAGSADRLISHIGKRISALLENLKDVEVSTAAGAAATAAASAAGAEAAEEITSSETNPLAVSLDLLIQQILRKFDLIEKKIAEMERLKASAEKV